MKKKMSRVPVHSSGKEGKKPTNEMKLTNKIKNKLSKRTLKTSGMNELSSAAIDFFLSIYKEYTILMCRVRTILFAEWKDITISLPRNNNNNGIYIAIIRCCSKSFTM